MDVLVPNPEHSSDVTVRQSTSVELADSSSLGQLAIMYEPHNVSIGWVAHHRFARSADVSASVSSDPSQDLQYRTPAGIKPATRSQGIQSLRSHGNSLTRSRALA
jgi:hypothetical protein